MDLYNALTQKYAADPGFKGDMYRALTGNFKPYLEQNYQEVWGANQNQARKPAAIQQTPVVDLSMFPGR